MEAERPGPGKDDTREEDGGPPGRHGGDGPAGSLLGPPCGDTGPENCVQHPGWGTSVPRDRPPGPGRHSGGREGTSPGVCRAHALPLYPVGSGPPHPKTPQGPAQLRGTQILSGDHGPGETRGAGVPPGQGALWGPCLQAVTPDSQQSWAQQVQLLNVALPRGSGPTTHACVSCGPTSMQTPEEPAGRPLSTGPQGARENRANSQQKTGQQGY